MCDRDDLNNPFRCHLPVVHRDRKTLVLDAHTRNLGQGLAQFGGGAGEDWYENRSGIVTVMRAVRPHQLEAVAACVPETGYADPAADIREVTTAQDGHRTHRGDEFQCLGGTVDEPGRTGIRDDGGQRPVVVQEQHRLACAGDADQLTVRLQCIRKLRDPLVTRANGDIGQVGEHHIGTVRGQRLGTRPVDADDKCEPAGSGRRHTGGGVLDDDTSLWSYTEPVDYFQKHCGIGVFGRSACAGDSVDADAEQVVDSGELQRLPALRARRIGRRCDADAAALPGQVDGGPEERRAAGQRTIEVEEHRVVVARVDGDRRFHDAREGTGWRSSSSTWRVVFTTVSGFRLIESIPSRTRNSAMSG